MPGTVKLRQTDTRRTNILNRKKRENSKIRNSEKFKNETYKTVFSNFGGV